MLSQIASSVGDILISNGIKMLGSTVKGTTELGLRKIGEFVKDKTGIDLYANELMTSGLTPEQIATLKKLEQEYDIKIKEMEIEYARLAIAEAANARKLQETALQAQNTGWLPKNFIYIFAGFWSVVGTAYLLGVCFMEVPPDNQRFVDVTLGYILGGVIPTIIGFFFGNSMKNSPLQRSADNNISGNTFNTTTTHNNSQLK